jgi:hypothetical protein
MGERLGYVVVCFNQASGQDLASGDVLYDDAADAIKFCARGPPSSGGGGIASPSLLLPCYADGAYIA